jgi:transposase
VIHSADILDRKSAELVFEKAKDKYPRLKTIFLDAGYSGEQWHQEMLKKYGWQMEVVQKKKTFNWFVTAQDVGLAPKNNFRVLKWRWIVERTFAWLTRWRRMSKDYEYLASTSSNLIYAIMLRLMVSRLSRNGSITKEARFPIKP